MDPSSPLPGCFMGFFAVPWRRFKRREHKANSRVGNPANISTSNTVPDTMNKPKESHGCFSPCCDFSSTTKSQSSSERESPPPYCVAELEPDRTGVSVVRVIEGTLDSLDAKLREISMSIHAHPEIMFEEKYAHDLLTGFMDKQGFQVTKHYLGLSTAWRAEFSFGSRPGPVVGINSEMDALRGIGHACGHNLIAVSGVGVAIALKAAMEKHQISGKLVLLGTPAEEAGGGKVILLERGGYRDMDVCFMCHPSPGDPSSATIGPTIAMQPIEVEFFGHSAHAGAAPWEGTNALDAAFLAYSSISMLRQQLKPDHRIHGVIQGKDWSPNVIPDYAKMRWLVRAPTFLELKELVQRVENCFQAAGMATSCNVQIKIDVPYYDLRQNQVLAQHFADVVGSKYGIRVTGAGTTASTDFGNVSYVLPVIHPAFAIPTVPQGGNHTPAFAKAAATQEAHDAMMAITKGLALTAFRALSDPRFLSEVKRVFHLGSNPTPQK